MHIEIVTLMTRIALHSAAPCSVWLNCDLLRKSSSILCGKLETRTHARTHRHTHTYIYTRQKRTYCSFLSRRVLCMPVLNLPRGTRGCFQGVISSCNNITFAVTPATILWSSKLLFFSPQPCTGFSLPNRVLCWRQCGTVI